MIDKKKVIKGLRRCSTQGGCTGCPYRKLAAAKCSSTLKRDALELLKEQDALLNKIYNIVSKWELDSPCDDLVCDDGWCEEHCAAAGTKPECIERWFKYLLKKGGEVG